MSSNSLALHRLAAIYVGGVLGALTRVGLAEAGHTHLVWLNLGLSLLAGFAAATLGHWLGSIV